MTKKQRLKRDPFNQRNHKFRGWVKKNLEEINRDANHSSSRINYPARCILQRVGFMVPVGK